MAKRIALGFLSAAPFAFLFVFFFAPRAASWIFPPFVMAFPIALVTLGVSRDGRVGRLRVPLIALCVLLQLGALGVSVFDGSGLAWLGLPLSLHFLLLLIWLGPLCITTLAYGLLFSELGIDDALVERLERMRSARRERSGLG